MKFSKQKMIERIIKEGKAEMLTEGILEIMDNLDGQECHLNSWRRQVYGEAVLACYGKDGRIMDVAEVDCY